MIKKYLSDSYDYIIGREYYSFISDCLRTGAYPIDLEGTLVQEDKYYEPRDEVGIPLRKYKSVGVRYNPTRIAAFGLAHWNRYSLSSFAQSLNSFEKCRDWFFNYPGDVWLYDFDWDGNRAPWASCMAQGEGASILVRAYEVTGDAKYLDKAARALRVMAIPVKEGGVRSKISERYEFLEEYPAGNNKHVLNGFLYAMIGIYDVFKHRPSIYKELEVERLLNTLITQINRWDLGCWSAYDLATPDAGRNFCTMAYHSLHCSQLLFLAEAFEVKELRQTAEQWLRYSSSLSFRMKALYGKVKHRAAVKVQR